ncbi:hypothetical protein JCM10213v2_000860 [Rhodosporidiobolus nylandii]
MSSRMLRASVSTTAPLSFSRPSEGKDSSSSSGRVPPPVGHQVPTTLETLSLAAFAEVESLRSTVDGLKSKITGLESLLLAAFGKLRDDPQRAQSVENTLQTHANGKSQQQPKVEHFSPQVPLPPTPSGSHPSLPHPLPPPFPQPLLNGLFVHPLRPESGEVSASPPPFPSLPDPTNTPTFALPPLEPSRPAYPFDFECTPMLSQQLELDTLPGRVASMSAGAGVVEQAATASTSDTARPGESSSRGRGEDLREEEVAASLSLEFMALGRSQGLNGAQSAGHNEQVSPDGSTQGLLPPSTVSDSTPRLTHPSSLFPNSASLAAVLPPQSDALAILEHAISYAGWCHGAVHGPTFRAEAQEFFAHPEEARVEQAGEPWLALLFAQLCCGVKHMTEEHLRRLGPHGITQEEARTLTKTYLDAAVACLYDSHFLENRQLHAIQAIAVLVVTCQDGGFSNLFPMLLSLGICMAQDLGLHRLPSDATWVASVTGQPLEQRARSLIAYETKKRVFWCLTAQEWFSIPYRRATAVQPYQVTTPLPSNAHDEDLMTGVLVNRPPAEYTVVSNLLIWIQIARILQGVFQYIDEHPTDLSYDCVLSLDAQLQALLENVPDWLKGDVSAPDLPPNAAWLRSTFKISSLHKIIVLHRPFFRKFETSRQRALEASRAILREAEEAKDSRMWTVPYQFTSAAASVVCLDLFQRSSLPSVLHEERSEILSALSALHSMSSFSAIAGRGAALVENLLSQERRLPPIPSPFFDDGRPSAKKRRVDHDTSPSLPSAAAFSPTPTPRSTGPASLSNLLASPTVSPARLPNGLVFPGSASPSLVGLDSSPIFACQAETPNSGFQSSSVREGLLEGGRCRLSQPNGLGLVDELPPFLSAFLESGFHSLDGASTSPAGGAARADGGEQFEEEGRA